MTKSHPCHQVNFHSRCIFIIWKNLVYSSIQYLQHVSKTSAIRFWNWRLLKVFTIYGHDSNLGHVGNCDLWCWYIIMDSISSKKKKKKNPLVFNSFQKSYQIFFFYKCFFKREQYIAAITWSCVQDHLKKISFPYHIEVPYDIWLWYSRFFRGEMFVCEQGSRMTRETCMPIL